MKKGQMVNGRWGMPSAIHQFTSSYFFPNFETTMSTLWAARMP